MNIETGVTLEVKNLISTRVNGTQAEIGVRMQEMAEYVKAHGASKNGFPITATYAVDPATQAMDMEVYIPIDAEVPSSDKFIFKPRLYLANCLRYSYKGNPMLLEQSIINLNQYIADNKLTPMTVGFNVAKHQATSQEDLDKFEVDIYISVSPNIL